jgi:hypothetical protein
MGSQVYYTYKKKRKDDVPPNAKFYTIKPIFDKNIAKVRFIKNEGKSLLYQSPLESPNLYEEVYRFGKLMARFFNGESNSIRTEYTKYPSESVSEIIVDNAKL